MPRAWSQMVDMELDDDDKLEMSLPPSIADQPDYPYGLRICLTHRELEKLGLDADCDVGDFIDLRAFGEVTSVSKSDGPDGPCCRVEIQLQKLAVENETAEEPGDE